MNILKRIYCRTVQIAFRIALPLLPYRKPQILTCVDEIPGIVIQKNYKKVFLVTGPNIRKRGTTAHLEEVLSNSGIGFVVYDKTLNNPTIDNVLDAYQSYVDNNCECIVAFGGGSPIDLAKAVGAKVAYPNKELEKLFGTLKVIKKIPLLIAIPTTAGSGSETTLSAVITDSNTHQKYPMNSFPLIPSYAVLEPKSTFTLPKNFTSTTGMDALTHAVEAYIGKSTTKETRKYSLEAIKLIFDNILTAYNDGYNEEARKNMLLASYYAGISFSKSYVGYVHAVAHTIGGKYNVPHGLANSIILPYVLESYGKKAYKKLFNIALYLGLVDENDSYEEGAKSFIEAIKYINKSMSIPNKIEEIKLEDISLMAKFADKEANPLYPVPLLMDAKELEKIYLKLV